MVRSAKLLTLGLLAALVTFGQVRAAEEKGPFAGFPDRYSDFAYKVGWQVREDNRGVVVDGLLRSLRYGNVDSITLSVRLVDQGGTVVARDTAYTMPQQLGSAGYRTFSVRLANAHLTRGQTLQFILWATGSEGGDNGFSWLTSFTVDAVSGELLMPKPGRNADEW